MEKLVLIDGNSLINRAFYALPLLSNSQGKYCNAIFGFVNILVKIITEQKPDYMAVAFDVKHPTFRHEMFKEYKGTRKATPKELIEQIDGLKSLLKVMKIKVLELPGFEADDLIGTMSKRFDVNTTIVSGDKDLLQLIDKSTNVWLTKKGITEIIDLDESKLVEFMGVTPAQIIDLKSLMGDSSDNIPGVTGIGEKTAVNLLQTYGSLENIYKNLDNIKGKTREKLENDADKAKLSYALATINTNAPIKCELNECAVSFPFNNDVYEQFKLYEFKSLLKKDNIFSNEHEEKITKNVQLIEIKQEQELDKLVEELQKVEKFSIFIDKNVHIALSKYQEYKILVKNDIIDEGLFILNIINKLKSILTRDKIKKVCFDVKFLMHILANYQVELKGANFDVNLAIYLLSGSKKTKDNILDIVSNFNYPEDAKASALLFASEQLCKELENDQMKDLYYNIEFPLIEVLFNMEQYGFKIDVDALEKINEEYDKEIQQLTKKIYESVGEEFNINSPKQLSEILFGKLGLPSPKKQSTSVDVLEKLVKLHPVVELVLRYRKIYKIKGTYLESFKKLVDKKTNLIHTIFHQTLTATGRLSSTEPNLQNIPIRDEEGKLLRKLFIPREQDGLIISADYSQIELRILAHYSNDENLITAYKEGLDIHTKTASDVFKVPFEMVTDKMRRDAKAVNFGIVYGISDFGLAQNLGISRKQAGEYIKTYFEKYVGVKNFMEQTVEDVRKTGFATTLLGRKRKVDEINSSNYVTRQFGERVAMNMPFQGSASDIIKLAMINVYKRMKQQNLKSKLILQIHDELIVDAVKEEAQIVKNILIEEMQNVIKLKVPLIVNVEMGNNWFDAK